MSDIVVIGNAMHRGSGGGPDFARISIAENIRERQGDEWVDRERVDWVITSDREGHVAKQILDTDKGQRVLLRGKLAGTECYTSRAGEAKTRLLIRNPQMFERVDKGPSGEANAAPPRTRARTSDSPAADAWGNALVEHERTAERQTHWQDHGVSDARYDDIDINDIV